MKVFSSSKLALVALLLFCSVTCQWAAPQSAVDKAQQMMNGLYSSIRSIANPGSPELDEDERNVATRFILLMPGKILNYHDYFPGDEYIRFIQV